MKDALLREQKDRLLTPIANRFFGSISPNVLSIVAVVPGLLSAAAVIAGLHWLGLGFWLLNRLLDGLDGLVARIHDKKSDLGGYLDLLLDFVIYLGLPIAFTVADSSPRLIWSLVALFAVYQMNTLSWTLLSSILEKRRQADDARLTSVEMPPGLIEGAETTVLYSLFFLLPGQIFWLFVAMSLLVAFTALQRIVWAFSNPDIQ